MKRLKFQLVNTEDKHNILAHCQNNMHAVYLDVTSH